MNTIHGHCFKKKKKKEEFRLIQGIFDWSNPCLDHFIKLNWKVLLVKSIQAIDLDPILETQGLTPENLLMARMSSLKGKMKKK